ncbi:hypothetical protein [Lysinibacillus sp. S2017]|uniref:hypothetical protein n=1 Tax=Lysinibacillus sp. S2017 TaxID=2561923 RepID=UPI0010925025|nr:hypothetical protein [Lysinibacillus sp. S2017]TGN33109.1 hypothetical protein E4L99_15235 [Lysinibacillus sp. S2017]
MIIYQLSFLFNRKPDGREILGASYIQFDSIADLRAATNEDKIRILIEEGYDVVRLIQTEENLIGVNFEQWDS